VEEEEEGEDGLAPRAVLTQSAGLSFRFKTSLNKSRDALCLCVFVGARV